MVFLLPRLRAEQIVNSCEPTALSLTIYLKSCTWPDSEKNTLVAKMCPKQCSDLKLTQKGQAVSGFLRLFLPFKQICQTICGGLEFDCKLFFLFFSANVTRKLFQFFSNKPHDKLLHKIVPSLRSWGTYGGSLHTSWFGGDIWEVSVLPGSGEYTGR